jgi:hypothetical protein
MPSVEKAQDPFVMLHSDPAFWPEFWPATVVLAVLAIVVAGIFLGQLLSPRPSPVRLKLLVAIAVLAPIIGSIGMMIELSMLAEKLRAVGEEVGREALNRPFAKIVLHGELGLGVAIAALVVAAFMRGKRLVQLAAVRTDDRK